jgi:hypothetical protein
MDFLIWLVPSVFILHDFEEIIVMENWLKKNEKDLLTKIPSRFHGYFHKVFPTSTAGFSVAVLVEYVGILVATIIAVTGKEPHWRLIGTLAVVTILFLHCFTHIAQAVYLKRYTPGVFTAIVVLVPFSLYFYNYFLSKQLITWNMIWVSIPLGMILVAILNQFGLFCGKRLVEK